jgi:hypothetical protein
MLVAVSKTSNLPRGPLQLIRPLLDPETFVLHGHERRSSPKPFSKAIPAVVYGYSACPSPRYEPSLLRSLRATASLPSSESSNRWFATPGDRASTPISKSLREYQRNPDGRKNTCRWPISRPRSPPLLRAPGALATLGYLGGQLVDIRRCGGVGRLKGGSDANE